MDDVEDIAADQLALLVAKRRLERLRRVDNAPGGIEQRDHIARVLDQLAEAQLAARQRLARSRRVLQRTPQLQGPAHRMAQPVQSMLDDVIDRAGLDVLGGSFLVERAGDDDERRVGTFPLDDAERLQAAEPGDGVIGQHDLGGKVTQRVEQLPFVVDLLALYYKTDSTQLGKD